MVAGQSKQVWAAKPNFACFHRASQSFDQHELQNLFFAHAFMGPSGVTPPWSAQRDQAVRAPRLNSHNHLAVKNSFTLVQ